MSNHWAENGDLIIEEKTRFRRVGWQINGGPNDGKMVRELTEIDRSLPMGGFSPLYVEVGD